MPMLDQGGKIGRYTILGPLAHGGMSELYLARQEGPAGFTKIVVIKIISPRFALDEHFVQMFENEARLAALLNQANIVQVFDFGKFGDTYYMAMEYVDGCNLHLVQKQLKSLGKTIPINIALRICGDVCRALHYAHNLTDAAQTPLQIIHRDVSLENIALTYMGEVKLLDFGIAKARITINNTLPGSVKGKFSYMAPEMILGQKIDHRIDIFAMGVTLYRLLLGKMPFDQQDHQDLFRQIVQNEPKRPRELQPDFPLPLEQIILRALEKNPDSRYLKAADLQDDLEKYLTSVNAIIMPQHLVQFMSEIFPAGTDEKRKLIQKLIAQDQKASTISSSIEARAAAKTASLRPPQLACEKEKDTLNLRQGQLIPISISAEESIPTLVHQVSSNTNLELTKQAKKAINKRKNRAFLGLFLGVIISGVLIIGKLSGILKVEDENNPAPNFPSARQQKNFQDGAIGQDDIIDAKIKITLPLKEVTPTKNLPPLTAKHKWHKKSNIVPAKVSETTNIKTIATPKASPMNNDTWGTLLVQARPWAKVIIDGVLIGSTPLEPIKTRTGVHQLILLNDDLKVRKRLQILIKENQQTTIKVLLP